MSLVNQIKAPIKNEMDSFESKFKTTMASKVPLLDKITHYIVKRKGKQMRPMFVFLSAKLCGELNESTYRGASMIELLHTATLVHDDVVDDANMRRGFFSINALWKNKIAVLVGDFLLSKGLLLAVKNEDFHLLKLTSRAVEEMSEGELLQIEKARRLDIVEDVYYEIIRKKTASLIAACCAVGCSSVSKDEELIQKMWNFGAAIGIAFQIKDDLFDYQKQGLIGKPVGIDIKDQKMTLPLIYALQHCDKSTRKSVINTIKRHHNNPKKVKEVIAFVRESGGLEYAEKSMYEYQAKAIDILSTTPDSEAKTSLQALIKYVIDRKK
jgi:octaprenyl-diphosphate synthase